MSRHSNHDPSPDGLVRDYNGNPLPHLANCVKVLEDVMTETVTTGCMVFNDLTHMPELLGRPPWRSTGSYDLATQVPDPDNPGQTIERKLALDDHEMRLAQVMIQRQPEAPLAVSYDTAIQAVEMIARRNLYHPVRAWLRGLPRWDGSERLGNWMHNFIDAPESDYTQKVGVITLVGAVARVMNPGCRFDTVTILEGNQGLLKSTICEVLGGPWYMDGLGSDGKLDKEACIAMSGCWVVELSEIDHLLRANSASTLKAYLSRRVDTYRPIYARKAVQAPRQSTFLGTTNKVIYLTDHTGNRRFLPIPVFTRGFAPNVNTLINNKDQLFAEALVDYDRGVPYHPTEDDLDMARDEAEERLIPDELDDIVEGLCREGGGWVSPITTTGLAATIRTTWPHTANWSGMVERVAARLHKLGYWKPKNAQRDRNRPGHMVPRAFYHD